MGRSRGFSGLFQAAFVGLGVLVSSSCAFAQGGLKQIGSKRYVEIKTEGNVEELFKDRLQVAKDLEPLRKLLDDARANPGKYNVPQHLLDQVDLNNPVFRALVKSWRDKNPAGTPFTLDSLKSIYNDLKRKGIDLGKLPQLPEGSSSGSAVRRGGGTSNPEDVWDADRLGRLVEDWLGDLDQYELSDWLRDSPAFQEGVADLRRLLEFNKDGSAWKLDNLPAHLRLPEGLNVRLGEGALKSLRNISMPSLPRIDLPRVRLGRLQLPGFGLPRVGGGGIGAISDTLFWALGIGVILAMLWIIIRRLGPRQRVAAAGLDLGPWPVDPALVSTRRELVQAFDHLSLLRLGIEVRTWNHRALAGEWLEAASKHREAIERIAQIYEEARYTRGDEALPPADRDAARRLLLLLRGAT